MATNNREPWPWEQAAPANVWQIPLEEQLRRDRIRKEELAHDRDAFLAEGRTADAQAAQMAIDTTRDGYGTDPALVAAGEGRRPPPRKDIITNPFAKDQPAAGREPWPWEQAPTASKSPYTWEVSDFATPEKPARRNPAAVINDWVIETANAALSLGKSAVDFVQPGTELAQQLQDLIDVGRRSQSLITQQAKQELEDAIDKGGWDAIRGVGGYVLKSPGLATAQVAGSAGPIGRAVKIGAAIGGARAGLGVGAGIGAITAGGDAAGNAYDMVRQSMAQQGYDPLVIEQAAQEAARRASIAPALVGGVTGMFGMERVLSGLGRGGAIRTGLSEGLQEGLEEGATQYSANVASQRYVPGLEATRGVVGSSALGFALGGIGGAGVGLLTGRPVDMLTGRPAPAGDQTTPTAPLAPSFNQVETDPNKVPREVAPGVYYTPSTGLYTLAENTPGIAAGRTMPRITPESGPYDLLGAGAPNVNVNQGVLPGIPMTLDQNIPTASNIEQMALGVQPGQQEMFMPNGQPTYGAAAPDTRRLAEARLQAEGLKPTDKRVELAVQAEEALTAGAIDEDTYNQIFSLLRESKYGRVGKMLTGARSVTQTTQAQQAEAQGPQTAVPAAATTVAMPAEQAAPTEQNIPAPPSAPMAEAQTAQAVEQQTAAVDNTVPLEQSARALEDQIRGIDEQMVSMLSKNGRTPVKGTAKAKQYAALGEQRIALRQQWDQVDRAIRAQRTPTAPVAAPVALTTPVAGGQNAVQVESTTAVPVQPRAEAGTRVGQEVRGAQEPAAESKQAEVSQAEEAVTEGTVTRKQATDRLVQEGGMARSDAIKYVNSVVDGFGQVRTADIQGLIDENKAATAKGGKPVYSRGQVQAGSTAAEVDSWIAPVIRLWKNAPPIRTVQTVAELDPSLKAPADAKGVFYDGEIVLVADNAKSKLDAMTTLFHEAVGHYGFRSLIRAESTEYVRLLTELEAQNPRIRELAKAWRNNNQQTIADLKADQGYTDTMVRALSLEEAMADMAYDALRNPGIRKVFIKSPAVRKFAQWVAKSLRALGMTELANKVQGLTDNLDVFALMSMSQNFVENGTKNSITTAHRIPLFSRDGATAPSEINETVQNYSTTTAKVAFDKARRATMGLRFMRDLKDAYGNKLAGLREYADKAFAMGARTNELLKEGSQISNRWASLGDEAEALSKLAGAATAAEIHPDIPLDKETHSSNGRSVSNAHLLDAEGKVSDEVEAEYDQLQAMWNKLTPKAKQVYFEARDYMHKNWMRRQDLLNKNVDAVYKPLIDAAQKAGNKEKVKALNKERTAYIREFGTLLAQVKGPYFPLMRFGKYYVAYKSDQYRAAEEKLNAANETLSDLYAKYDIPMTLRKEIDAAGKSLVKLGEDPSVLGLSKETKAEFAAARKAVNDAQKELTKLTKEGDKHYANEAFESEVAAEQRAAELGSRVRLAKEYHRELNPVTRGFIEKLSDAVSAGLPQSQAAKARESIVQIYLAALPETSALKRQLKRKGVAGFNEDMLRAFSAHTQRDSHYLSRLEYMDDMSAELQRMSSGARTKDQEALYNEMARRHAASLSYHQSPIENGLASLAFVYQLGVSPAFLLTNMTQPWMVSMPFMTGKHSAGKVTAALAKGFADASKAAATSFKEQGMNFEIDLNKFSADEKAMLESAMKDGLLDITLEIDLGAYAKGAGKGTFSKIMRAMGVVPHQAEVINRVMTALAAYRLATGKGESKEVATDYAKQVLDKTHIDYSATNAPYWLKPGVVPFGKLFFQYRKYQIGMLSLLGTQWRNALKGESKEVRREARRMLFGLHVNHALMTGAMGLPGVGTAFFIANLLNAAFGDDDEPFDAEAEFRKYLAESLGVEEGMVAAKGLPTLLGIDVSRNVGMGDIAAPIRLLRDDKKGRDLYTEVLMAGLGPTIGGLGPQFADGIAAMADGDYYRGVEGLTPRFVRDFTRAIRMSEEGLTTKAGQTVFTPDEIDSWNVTLQALGVPSTFVTERQAAVSAVEGAKTTITERRTELTRAYVQARANGDSEALSDVMQQIREYNSKRRAKREPIIKPQDLLKAYKQRRQYTRDVNEQGISLPRKQRAYGAYGSFANVTGEQ